MEQPARIFPRGSDKTRIKYTDQLSHTRIDIISREARMASAENIYYTRMSVIRRTFDS